MIKIVKVYDKQVIGTHREYCGRPGKGQAGLLGNPFWMKDESQRIEVCDKFHEYFHELITRNVNALMSNKERSTLQRIKELVEIAKTQDIELACFCSPKRCHTETIKAYIEEQLNKPVMTYHNGEWVDASSLVMSEDTYTSNDVGEKFYEYSELLAGK